MENSIQRHISPTTPISELVNQQIVPDWLKAQCDTMGWMYAEDLLRADKVNGMILGKDCDRARLIELNMIRFYISRRIGADWEKWTSEI